MLYFHRYVFALIKPKLADEYGLDNTHLVFWTSLFPGFISGCKSHWGWLPISWECSLFFRCWESWARSGWLYMPGLLRRTNYGMREPSWERANRLCSHA